MLTKKIKQNRSIGRTKKALAKSEGYISLAEAAGLCAYSQEYLSLLARQGLLKAEKVGRNWFTKKEWLKEYIQAHPADKRGNVKGELLEEKRFKQSLESSAVNKNLKTLSVNFIRQARGGFFLLGKKIYLGAYSVINKILAITTTYIRKFKAVITAINWVRNDCLRKAWDWWV